MEDKPSDPLARGRLLSLTQGQDSWVAKIAEDEGCSYVAIVRAIIQRAMAAGLTQGEIVAHLTPHYPGRPVTEAIPLRPATLAEQHQ